MWPPQPPPVILPQEVNTLPPVLSLTPRPLHQRPLPAPHEECNCVHIKTDAECLLQTEAAGKKVDFVHTAFIKYIHFLSQFYFNRRLARP